MPPSGLPAGITGAVAQSSTLHGQLLQDVVAGIFQLDRRLLDHAAAARKKNHQAPVAWVAGQRGLAMLGKVARQRRRRKARAPVACASFCAKEQAWANSAN